MNALKKTETPQNSLSGEQVKLLEYVGDLSQELSQLARAGGFVRISELLQEAVTEVKAIR
jgi:hypothetical protein